MQLTSFQIKVLIGTGAFIFIVILLVTGVIPGLRKITDRPPELILTVWGIEDRNNLQEAFNRYQALRTNVGIDYEFINPETYERDIVNALAAGKGPDIIMFHRSWLPKHYNKVVPLKETQLKFKDFQELFPTVAEQDFSSQGIVYALPLYIDTLALFYNQDTFDKNGIAVTPKDWLGLQNLIPKLRQKDASGKIIKPAVAIGGSAKNIDNASDLLMLLMLQAGAKMTADDFTNATFASNVEGLFPGVDALKFYTKFSDASDIYYTWNDSLVNSLDGFSEGDLAMMFNYASKRKDVAIRNPFLNFTAAEMPQPTGADRAVNYPEYWGLAVTNNSQNPDWAWDLALYLTANEEALASYIQATGHPPALRSMIQKYVDHPELGVFATQALSARSWPQIDKERIDVIFSDMIQSVIDGNLDIVAAVSQAESQVTELMRTRR